MPSTGNASVNLNQLLPPAARARAARWAPFLLFLGLLVLCGYVAARLSWQFAAPPPGYSQGANNGASPGARTAQSETPGAKIVAAHLFGAANAPGASVAARNAPETSLNLSLAGVAAASAGSSSYAIITNNNTEHTYGVGAKLPDDALIRNILSDRVVIAHNGHLETLRLPNLGTAALAAPANAGPGANRGHKRAPLVSKGFREQVASHPKSIAQYMQLRPYEKNGHLMGYRVYPGKKPQLFKKAGLQPGDIVTSVNGVTLNAPGASLKAMRELHQARGPVRLEILRKGHHMSVTINAGGG
jgi:general secretion pathway protein C